MVVDNLIILDGGMGHELAKRGVSTHEGLWSAQALLERPDLVAQVHSDYIEAGARTIITNSYSTIPSYLEKEGMADRYVELTQLAGQIARKAADESSHDVRVAGSLPPLGTSYRPDMVPEDRESFPIYEKLTETLLPYVDLFLCETMSRASEASNAAACMRKIAGSSKSLWVSWSLDDKAGKGLRSGESIRQAFEAVSDYSPDAFLFNCTEPNAISVGLKELRELTEKPIGAYPNRFHVPEGWTLDNEVPVEPTDMSEEEFVAYAQEWRESGASIVGGCCGVGPSFIKALAVEATQ